MLGPGNDGFSSLEGFRFGMANDNSRRLLIVEDNPTDEIVLRRAILEEGLEVNIVVMKDGEKALDYLEKCSDENAPHVVIIDLNLPKRDGLEVLRKCRFRPALTQTKTLIFTSSDEPSDHSRSDLLGAHAYLRKPNHLNQYKTVVTKIRDLLS